MSYSDYLAHYGVLGMKWGVHRNPEKAYSKSKKKLSKYDARINKYDVKAKKQFTKGIKKSGGLFSDEKGAKEAFTKSKKYSRKALNNVYKAEKWIGHMEKEFAKQSVVSIEPSVISKGTKYRDRITAAADTIYVRDL